MPVVTVLCLCYNHARFVAEAIESVFEQTYSPVQLIVLDDGSTDNSTLVIEQLVANKPEVKFIRHPKNVGYCASLNDALRYAKGEFIIDLAADDVLLPTRIQVGVDALANHGSQYGVHFSDAILMSETGETLSIHSSRHPHSTIPQGDVYVHLINRYFICPPSLLFRKNVIDRMGGYDESLAFEDFDFLVRASRCSFFCYSRQALVKKRSVANSLVAQQFKRNSTQRWATFQVCKKIQKMNRSREEDNVLISRLFYEIRVSLRLIEFRLAWHFWKLLLSVVFARHHA